MTITQLPAYPGYIFTLCNKDGSFDYRHEVWSVRDMSQVCQGDIGQCGIVSKVPLEYLSVTALSGYEPFTATGVNGLGNPFVFGTWYVDFGTPRSVSDPWSINGFINDPTDNLQWDTYQISSTFWIPKIGPAEWACSANYFAFDIPRSLH